MATVHLSEDLLRRVEAAVGTSDDDVSAFVEEAVRQGLARRRARSLDQPDHIAPVGASGVLPVVDLTRWNEFIEAEAADTHRGHLSA